jgi:AbrB family looped-hinge helix DNA binding protein
MTPIKGTVTSKNQVTLPAKLVRKYGLNKGRMITFTDKDGAIEIRPQPSLGELMAPIWKETAKYIRRPISDEELKQAIRQTKAARGGK